jgi:hypothetical protein
MPEHISPSRLFGLASADLISRREIAFLKHARGARGTATAQLKSCTGRQMRADPALVPLALVGGGAQLPASRTVKQLQSAPTSIEETGVVSANYSAQLVTLSTRSALPIQIVAKAGLEHTTTMA